MIVELTVVSHRREEMIDLTDLIKHAVRESELESGVVTCFVPHTTAGITINENADPDVKRDILYKLRRVFPQDDDYHHAEGNSDAHIKASLMGFSLQLLFEDRKLLLGQWQGVMFCEFDGPRRRRLVLRVSTLG